MLARNAYIRACRATALAAALLVGCTGLIGDPGESATRSAGPSGPDTRPNTGPDTPACTTAVLVGSSPTRRLSRAEYNNTVRDLLGDATQPGRVFPPDEGQLTSGVDPGLVPVSTLLATAYQTAAEDAATRAVANLRGLMGCDPSGGNESECAQSFIERFARRAYRRPLAADETTRLLALYTVGRTGGTPADGAGLVVRAVLQSPGFLYRAELGESARDGATAVRLDSHQVASRLSYFLWGSMPDDVLFAAADADELARPEQVAAQARRMLDDPRARQAVQVFYDRWLGLGGLPSVERDRTQYPEWDTTLRQSLGDETRRFVEYVTFEGDHRLETLLTADFSFLDASLARVYGVSAPSGTGLVRTQLPATERAGLLTQASFLTLAAHADQTSPVLRGRFVREQLLCQPMPNPPPDANAVAPPIEPGTTTRERFSTHATNPSCASCHRLMDPLGLGFEHYDSLGRYRATDQDAPVDASGEVVGSTDADGAFDGAPALAQRLARSDQVRHCVATQWFRFAFGRSEQSEDACSMQALNRAFAASGYDLRELLVALTQTDAFLYRRADTAAQEGL